jgi:hypothetical protein
MGYRPPRIPRFPHEDRLRECFERIEAAVGTYAPIGSGNGSGGGPDDFNVERWFFDAVKVSVNFEPEDADHLRYSVRIEQAGLQLIDHCRALPAPARRTPCCRRLRSPHGA